MNVNKKTTKQQPLPDTIYAWWDEGGGKKFVNCGLTPDCNPEQEMLIGVYKFVGTAKVKNETTITPIKP